MRRAPERLLMVRVGAMGDVLHALPAVAALRQQRPDLEIGWVIDPRWAPLLVEPDGSGPLVARAHLAETRLWSRAPLSGSTRRSILALRRGLRVPRYPLTVDVQGTLRSGALSWLAGCPERVGFADPRESLARRFYTRPLPRQGAHVVLQNAALLGEVFDLPLQPVAPALPLHAEAAERIAALAPDAATALLAVTAGWGAKQWPSASFGALARALAQRGWRVLLNAAHPRDPVPLAVAKASDGAAEVVHPDVAELVALTRRVGLAVGGDTGPVHLAAASGVPTVALFGPTDPARTGPWGPGPLRTLRSPHSQTSHKRIPTTEPGLAALPVEDVLQAVDEVAAPRLRR